MLDGDPVLLELGWIADSREHQNLRGVNHPCAQQHFLVGAHFEGSPLMTVSNPRNAIPVKEQRGDQCTRVHRQMSCAQRGAQKGGRSRAATTISDGELQHADAVLIFGVVVLDPRVPV